MSRTQTLRTRILTKWLATPEHRPPRQRKGYARRVLESQLIQPVTQSDWYHPLVTLQGVSHPVDLPRASLPVAPAFWQTLHHDLDRHQTHALLVLHRGKLVHEYYRGFDPLARFNSMSMIKTITALMIGIAIDRGLIGSVHDAAADYLPEWQQDERRFISIEHLLTMQSGLQGDVMPRLPNPLPPVLPLYLGHDLKKIALSLPAVARPGQYFEYNNFNTQLLGQILANVSQRPLPELFSEWLWQPLGARDARLWADDQGMVRTFAALFATPQDWLRVGQLFINQGEMNGQRIVSAEWIRQMLIPRNDRQDYGYQVWLKAHDYGLIRGIPFFEAMHARQPLRHERVFFLEGMRGQYVYVDPVQQLVVLRMGEKPRKDWDASHFINEIGNLIEKLDKEND